MRGMYFSKREKAYIARNAESKSHADIAARLADLYPEDNGGHRSKGGVQAYLQRIRKQSEGLR